MRSADYFQQLDEATVKFYPEEQQVSDFDWLVDQYDVGEGLLYKTTKVVVRRGLIVAYRSLVTAGRQLVEDKTFVHIADVQTITEVLSCELRNKSVNDDTTTIKKRDDDSSCSDLKVASILTAHQA